jgi:hypothetical protein
VPSSGRGVGVRGVGRGATAALLLPGVEAWRASRAHTLVTLVTLVTAAGLQRRQLRRRRRRRRRRVPHGPSMGGAAGPPAVGAVRCCHRAQLMVAPRWLAAMVLTSARRRPTPPPTYSLQHLTHRCAGCPLSPSAPPCQPPRRPSLPEPTARAGTGTGTDNDDGARAGGQSRRRTPPPLVRD